MEIQGGGSVFVGVVIILEIPFVREKAKYALSFDQTYESVSVVFMVYRGEGSMSMRSDTCW